MTQIENPKRYVASRTTLPKYFPTHAHSSEFWETLGRTIATFGFLEEVLGRAIFALTATREIQEAEIEAEFVRWLSTLEHALSDPLAKLITAFAKAACQNKSVTIANLDGPIDDLQQAAALRNVACHGSWRRPDADGKSISLFVNTKNEIFETAIDVAYLHQLRQHVV